ncbi:unnamed protein product [Schistocephalus solidus]|uniref:Uncharacterized protein n=1 Tax=Schistocephalus solidus TaxID=70667 RepID=A0A3P7D8Q7_SCHSO|nr:unnamed protein product [Schistocephalus solidus]
MFTEFRALYQYNSAATSILPALIYALPQFMSPFLCPITDVIGYSTSAAWGALFLCLSFLFTSVAKTMELTYFSFGLITALGLQLTYTAAFMAVVSMFKDSKYFGIACGIMVSGGGIGSFATNHIVAWILSLWTLREALIILAAFLLHAWFSAALFYWVDETAIIEKQLRGDKITYKLLIPYIPGKSFGPLSVFFLVRLLPVHVIYSLWLNQSNISV